MELVAISVGRPSPVQWRGRRVNTAIFKTGVAGLVNVVRHNVEGDQQADLSVHGGPDKTVYAYPSEHYAFWRGELPDGQLPWGAFGENLTIRGLLEDQVRIGDRYRIGTATLVVTQPRIPCFKLAIRFGRTDIVRRFLQSRRSGFYLAVEQEGHLETGDAIERVGRDDPCLTVADVLALYAGNVHDRALLERASNHSSLPASWRDHFRKRLAALEA